MSNNNFASSLIILVFFLGCSSEVVEPPAGKSTELTESARLMELNSSPGTSLFMFYKAASSNGICYAQIIPNDNKCTALDKRLKFDGKDQQSSESPSQAFYNNKLYIVYKAGRSNDIYYSYFDGEKWQGDTKISVNGTNIQTSKAPAAFVFNNKLYIVYKGGSSTSVYYSYFDGVSWKGDTRIDVNGNNIETSESPAATVFNNKMYVFYKGRDANYIYSSYLDGTTWKGNTRLSVDGKNLETTHGPAAAVFNNNLYFICKAGNSNILNYAYFDGIVWRGNTKIIINGKIAETSKAPSATVLNNRLYIAYRAGTSEDIFYSSFDGQVWRGNNAIFGIGTSSSANIIPNPFELKPFVTSLLSISPTEKKVYFNSSTYYPYDDSNDNSHVQGIQVAEDGRFLISTSNFSSNFKRGLIIPVKNGVVETGNIKGIEGYGHAGGIQYRSGTLAVPLATTNEPSSQSKKFIRFYSDDINLPPGNLTNEQDIEVFAKNSSAAGFVDINETQRLVVVNTDNDMNMVYQILNKVNNVWQSDSNWKPKSHPDAAGSAVQNINLFKEGDLYYLIGLRNADIETAQERDALDVYTFSINGALMSDLTLLGSLNVHGDDRQRMRSGGGVNVMSNGEIIISSYGRGIYPGDMVIWTYTK